MKNGDGRRRTSRSTRHGLLGVAFIVGGLVLLASRVGWLDIGPLREWWPLLVIGVGLALLAWGLVDRSADLEGGVWVLAAGVYGAVGVWQPYGLSWATGWPVMIVALGVTFLLESAGRGQGRDSAGTARKGNARPAPGTGEEARHDD